MTGRGSIPPSPLQPLPGTTDPRQLAILDNSQTQITKQDFLPTLSSQIIEAQGFVKNANGEILLVTQVPKATASAATTTVACH